MATTVSSIQSSVNQYIRDTSTDSISANDRLRAISEAVKKLATEVAFDYQKRTLTIPYLDTINDYNITALAPDLGDVADMYFASGSRQLNFSRKNPREIRSDIDNGEEIPSFAIDIDNGDTILYINHTSKYGSKILHSCESLTDNGTWTADTTNGDATNLTEDSVEYKVGNGSINFDIDVSQTANNKAVIYNSDMTAIDLSDDEDLSSALLWVYIPDTTYTSSVTLYWGSSTSAYWFGTATTDYMGNAFSDGWNRIKVDWSDTTAVGTPDSSAIDYLQVDINFTASQGDDTDYRINDFRMARPENITLQYHSEYIGTSSAGVYLSDFTATSDIPIYSGVYDNFNVYVAHEAASIIFFQMGLQQDGTTQAQLAQIELQKLKKKFPSSSLKSRENFKVNLKW